ncbi:calcium-activated BK potassium channel alpha subunit-domain-containing protein [Entophlyctis helioformis]|nr:calcium-activated BK potassium channel alpha subunit-domain-containing protein [Entophlyctis helioformis]
MDVEDLMRVQLKHASAAFILADPFAPNKVEEDDHNTLRSWAFDDYAPQTPLYVDNLLPGTELIQSKTTTASLCLDDFKQIFLGYDCLYSGVGTLMINLLQQSATDASTDFEDPWRAQYADGVGCQVYQTPINPVFAGFQFTDVSFYAFSEFQVILIGVATQSDNDASGGLFHIVLNPGPTYTLSPTDQCIWIALSEDDVKAANELV